MCREWECFDQGRCDGEWREEAMGISSRREALKIRKWRTAGLIQMKIYHADFLQVYVLRSFIFAIHSGHAIPLSTGSIFRQMKDELPQFNILLLSSSIHLAWNNVSTLSIVRKQTSPLEVLGSVVQIHHFHVLPRIKFKI